MTGYNCIRKNPYIYRYTVVRANCRCVETVARRLQTNSFSLPLTGNWNRGDSWKYNLGTLSRSLGLLGTPPANAQWSISLLITAQISKPCSETKSRVTALRRITHKIESWKPPSEPNLLNETFIPVVLPLLFNEIVHFSPLSEEYLTINIKPKTIVSKKIEKKPRRFDKNQFCWTRVTGISREEI